MKRLTRLDIQPLFAFLLSDPPPDGYKITEFISRLWPTLEQQHVYAITQQCKALVARLAALPKTDAVKLRTQFVETVFKQNPTLN